MFGKLTFIMCRNYLGSICLLVEKITISCWKLFFFSSHCSKTTKNCLILQHCCDFLTIFLSFNFWSKIHIIQMRHFREISNFVPFCKRPIFCIGTASQREFGKCILFTGSLRSLKDEKNDKKSCVKTSTHVDSNLAMIYARMARGKWVVFFQPFDRWRSC